MRCRWMSIGLCCAALWAGGCGGDWRRYEFSQPHMGTRFNIVLYAQSADQAQAASAAGFARIAAIDAMMSDYQADSELNRLSDTAGSGQAVALSDELFHVLSRSVEMSQRTNGAFDVTVGPYVRLWRRARRQQELPSEQRLAEARAAVGYRHLRLDAATKTATLAVPNMRLDLGAIAKGYACDEALRVMRGHGVTRALVDGGGGVSMGDPPPDRPGWRVEIRPLGYQSVDGAGGDASAALEAAGVPRYVTLSNAAVATSGDAFQHVVIGGVRYSHLIDPATGLGLTDQSAVTVIAPDGITADSLSSSVCVLGPVAGLELIDATAGAEAVFVRVVDGQVQVHRSKRFDEMVRPADAPAQPQY